MPAAKALSVRQAIVQRRAAGERFTEIAHTLDLAYNTVRRIWQQFAREGEITPHYARCRHTAVRKDETVYSAATQLKATHPGWGAGLVRLELATHFPEAALPSERTLQRWFHRAGVAAVPRDQRARPTVMRGQHPHEVWALDAKEQIRLADGSYVSWLTITDEGSGAILSADLFPPPVLDADRPPVRQASGAGNDDRVGLSATDTDG